MANSRTIEIGVTRCANENGAKVLIFRPKPPYGSDRSQCACFDSGSCVHERATVETVLPADKDCPPQPGS